MTTTLDNAVVYDTHTAGAVRPNLFIHYSTKQNIEAICAVGLLRLSDTIINSVFCVAVGGHCVPGVQHGRGENGRDCAVLFTSEVEPAAIFVEEAVWWTETPIHINVLCVLETHAADALLDASCGIPDDGWHHAVTCACTQCVTRSRTLGYTISGV